LVKEIVDALRLAFSSLLAIKDIVIDRRIITPKF